MFRAKLDLLLHACKINVSHCVHINKITNKNDLILIVLEEHAFILFCI